MTKPHPLTQGRTPRDTAEKTRGVCPRCRKNVKVTAKGKCASHKYAGGPHRSQIKCPGSGMNAQSLYS